MTNRIRCTSPDCSNDILPSTAARTGGLCAPCKAKEAAAERRAFVEAHRTTVDRFAGISDVVEYVWRMYEHPLHDELVQQTPPTVSFADAWAMLGDDDVIRLKGRLDVLDPNDDLRLSLYDGLAAHRDDLDLDEELRRRLEDGHPTPAFLYRHAQPPLVLELLERLTLSHVDDAGDPHLPAAAAWCRGDIVERTFDALLRRGRPSYGHVGYDGYLQEAGWELRNGARHDLFRSTCVEAKPAHAGEVDFRACAPAEQKCSFCGGGLEHVLLWEADSPDWFPPNVDVVTCPICVAFSEGYFVRTRGAGRDCVHPSTTAEPPSDVWEHTTNANGTPYALGRRRRPQQNAWWLATDGSVSQFGGMPTWIGDAWYPKCPDCRETMRALLQLECDEVWGCEGLLYVMDCDACSTAATLFQQT